MCESDREREGFYAGCGMKVLMLIYLERGRARALRWVDIVCLKKSSGARDGATLRFDETRNNDFVAGASTS